MKASKLDQAAADRGGYEARDDYFKAAAQEWICRAFTGAGCMMEQAALARCLKVLIDQDNYPATGIHDEVRFEQHVRSYLRNVVGLLVAGAVAGPEGGRFEPGF